MASVAQFPAAPLGAGMYESFYLRTFSPTEPVGLWIRYTVHKAPSRPPRGSIWCVAFDARRGRPFMHKVTRDAVAVPDGGRWIEIDGDGSFGPDGAEGCCGEASWSLRISAAKPELRHLSPELLYRTALPRTKLTSPAPAARFEGTFERAGTETLELNGWPGMIGHNWGAEHAERWIWLHGTAFEQRPDAWIDVGLGRLSIGSGMRAKRVSPGSVGSRMTPWAASGCLSLDGRRHRLGGLLRAGVRVSEGVGGCSLTLPGARGLTVQAVVSVPDHSAAGWRYADPDGGEHDVVNCSVARLELEVRRPGERASELSTPHGGAYELGMRERDHGVPIAPFPDG
jgi:hypothetical protein